MTSTLELEEGNTRDRLLTLPPFGRFHRRRIFCFLNVLHLSGQRFADFVRIVTQPSENLANLSGQQI